MENKNTVRLIDELGRVVLPAEARNVLEWGDKTAVEIWVNANEQEIVIRKHIHTCIFCGGTENTQEFGKKYVCGRCKSGLSGHC